MPPPYPDDRPDDPDRQRVPGHLPPGPERDAALAARAAATERLRADREAAHRATMRRKAAARAERDHDRRTRRHRLGRADAPAATEGTNHA